MRILITGAGGFLGRRAARHFSSVGYDVLTPSHSQLDITDLSAVDSWFRQNCPDAVIHCAAVSDTGLCQREPEKTGLINVTGSMNLAQACARHGIKFIFCSSDQVYNASSLPGPHPESEILTPGTVYARQKLLAEQQCMNICPDTVSLRLSWMYSAQMQPNEHGHLISTLCHALKDPSCPLSWSPNDQRGITDADSVVRQLPAVLNLPAGVYNFGSGNNSDMYRTIYSVFAELDLRDALSRLTPNLTAFADSPRDIRMDCSLAESFGISFESTHDGLCRALKQALK